MGNMNFCPVLNDTVKHYAQLDRLEDKATAIYSEAVRLIDEETSDVISEIYGDETSCNRFESAIRQIAMNFSTSQVMLASDDISDLMHTTAMSMATKEWERKHGMA